MMHKVVCFSCGKKGRLEVERGNKISDKNWHYFGKHDLNSLERSRYLYRVISLHPKFEAEKVINKSYDKEAKPKLAEEWECKECFEEHIAKEISPKTKHFKDIRAK